MQKDNARALQKTGTNEEVNEFIETLTNLLELYENHEAERKGKSKRAKAKVDGEKQASLELREAAMKGVVKRQALFDITQLDGATAREKSGQRGSKRIHSPSLEAENSKLRPAAKRAHSVNQQIEEALVAHKESMSQRLSDVRARDTQFHDEIKGGFEVLTKGLAELTETMRLQVERDAELRRMESEARIRDSEHMNQVLALLTASLVHAQLPSAPNTHGGSEFNSTL
ncbi:hypothetical protein NMY22_g15068 [Coprinellus aureogranulatus]|nr:hypothetical protein NMY22_g15068 [Coprinellus aureogranulatus]